MWKDVNVLITGATGGLGETLCHVLAVAGANLIVHGRDKAKLEVLAKRAGARMMVADLSSLDEAAALARDVDPVDVLINNAGVGFGKKPYPREVSRDGHELRFAVNYLAPVVITRKLLARGAVKAIVNVASAGQLAIDLDDLMSERKYDGVAAYRRSKLALVMHTFDVAAEQKVPIDCLHPGTYLDTQMVRDAGITPHGPPEQGADAITFVAEQARAGTTGTYFDEKRVSRADPQAYDATARHGLRDRTDELIGRYL